MPMDRVDTPEVAFEFEKDHLAQVVESIDRKINNLNADADQKTDQANSFYALDAADREEKRALHNEARKCRDNALEYSARRGEPYFRRIDTTSVRDEDGTSLHETLYVGRRDLVIDGKVLAVAAWNPRAVELSSAVETRIGDETVTVLLRRSLEVQNSTLVSCTDEYTRDAQSIHEEGVCDPFLLNVLNDSRRRHAPVDIIRTIQKNQMDIIRFPEQRSLIVQGCAGSGKTMILLHRLSYLAYHNKGRDWSRTLILSANPAFNEYITELCRELDIAAIPRSNYEAYLASLIHRYSGWKLDLAKLRSEENLNTDFLGIVYSKEFADSLRKRAGTWWDEVLAELRLSGLAELADAHGISFDDAPSKLSQHTNEQWNELYLSVRRMFSNTEQRLQTAKKDLDRAQQKVHWAERTLERASKDVQEAKDAVQEWLDVMAPDIEEAYAAWNMEALSDQTRAAAIRSTSEITTALIQDETLPQDAGKILAEVPGSPCLQEYAQAVTRLAEQTDATDSLQQTVLTLTSRIANIEADLPSEADRAVLDAAAAAIGKLTENAIMSGPVAAALTQARRKAHAGKEDGYHRHDLYRHQLYLRLLVCTWYYDRPARSSLETALYIDEAQDYAPAELELLRAVNGTSCTFDIFGDLLQRTNAGRGISDWTQLEKLTRTVFELNQNYRNTLQIAEFSNAQTGSELEPIGITGPEVDIVSLEGGIWWVVERHKEDLAQRAVIIVPELSEEVHELFSEAEQRGDVVWGAETDALADAKSAVPIISVQQSKGREYEIVFTVVDPEDRNASYVAYTRAMQELMVCPLRPMAEEAVAADQPAPEAAKQQSATPTQQAAVDGPAADEDRPRMLVGREYRVGELFTDAFSFHVPNYQRPFSWTRDEAKQLLDDLRSAMEQDTAEYFLGSVVVIRDGDNPASEIIDGQQRITTLSILAAAIADLSSRQLRERAESMVVSGSTGAPVPRLQLRERDDAFYKEYISTCDFRAILAKNPKNLPEAQANLANVARFFSCELGKMQPEEIDALLTYICTRCSMIAVMTPDYRSAFRIFSVLNHRGMDLQSSDILKAQMIGGLTNERQNEYAKLWESMEAHLGREAFNRFFDQILQSTPNMPHNVNASEYILDHVLRGPGAIAPKDFIDNLMLPKYKVLSTILGANYENLVHGRKINQALGRLNLLPNEDWVPAAIVWMEKYGDDALRTETFFRKLETLAFYMWLTSSEFPRDKRASRYRAICEQLYRVAEPAELELSLEERNRFRSALRGDVYRRRSGPMTKYLLLHLETALGGASRVASGDLPQFEIEHILPETMAPDSRWARDWSPEEHAQWTNKLANLVPLARRIPAARRDSDFAEKKAKYLTEDNSAGFGIAGKIREQREWVPETVSARQDELLAALFEHWNLDSAHRANRTSAAAAASAASPAAQKNTVRKPGTRITLLKIVGQTITFDDDPRFKATVVNGSSVLFEGKMWTLSRLTRELKTRLGTRNASGVYRGIMHWNLDGTRLIDLLN